MGHDQVVGLFGRSPQQDVVMEVTHSLRAVRPVALQPLPRQSEHPLTRIQAIDRHLRMKPQQLAQKPPIPLPYDKGTPRPGDLIQRGDTTTLEIVTKGDPLQGQIPGRKRVETHAFMTSSASKGVRRTRSGSATR